MPHKVFFVEIPGETTIGIVKPSLSNPRRAIMGDAAFEDWAVKKSCFESSRRSLPGTHTDNHDRCWCRVVHFDPSNPEHIDVPTHVTGSCDEDDLPSDRYFRDAWVAPGPDAKTVTTDMPHARGIQMDKIRLARNAELVKLDITFMRAIEDGDMSAQSIVGSQKQSLRDIPQTFDLTTDTPDELKAKWPSELPNRD